MLLVYATLGCSPFMVVCPSYREYSRGRNHRLGGLGQTNRGEGPFYQVGKRSKVGNRTLALAPPRITQFHP